MNKKWLICSLILLLMIAFGALTNNVYAAFDYEAYTFSAGGGFSGYTLDGSGISYGGTVGIGTPGRYEAWTNATYNNTYIVVKDTTTGREIARSGAKEDGIYSCWYTTEANHSYKITFYNPNTTYWIYGTCQIAEADKNYTITGSDYYKTLKEAIASASADDTIKVLKSNTDTSTVTFSKNLKLNTNGYTIKRTKTITINNGVTLNVIGSGKITTAEAICLITNKGELSITSATISNTSTSNEAIQNNNIAIINSGTVSSNKLSIDNYGTLYIKGGTVKAASTYAGDWVRAVYSREKSEVIMSGGTITGNNTSTAADSYGGGLCGPGSKTISAGTITAKGYRAIAVDVYSSEGASSELKISGTPTLTATSTTSGGYAYGVRVAGTSSASIICPVTISGGKITATALTGNDGKALYDIYNDSVTQVTGGTFKGSSMGIHLYSAGMLIYGSSTADLSASAPSASGGTAGVVVNAGFYFNNGIIIGSNTTPYTGTPTPRSDTTIQIDGPTNSLYSAYLTGERNYQNGSKYYTNLSEAVAGATAGNTITVIATKEFTDKSTVIFDKNLTFNTNGKTILKQDSAITINSGVTLKITGTGYINGGDNCHIINNKGTLEITSATIRNDSTATSYYGIMNSGTLNVNSGKVSSKYRSIYNTGTANIKGGTIAVTSETNSYKNAIYQEDDAKLNISGGTIIAENTVTDSQQSVHTITGMGDITISGSPIITSKGNNAFSINYPYGDTAFAAQLNISGTPTITATATAGYGYAIRLYGNSSDTSLLDVTAKISGGTITATSNTATMSNSRSISSTSNTGTITITDGTFEANGAGIYVGADSGKLTYGDKNDEISTEKPSASGGTNGVYAPGGFNFYNGIIIGSNTTPYTGTANIRTGYERVIDGPVDGMYSAYLLGYNNYLVNGNTYALMTDAIAAATEGAEITVIRAHTDSSNAIIDKNIILNTNGIDIKRSSYPITVNYGCSLSIIGNGSITAETGNTIVNNGILDIKDVTIDNETEKSSNIINNASAVVTVNSGTIKSKFMAINNYGTLNIKGGIIQSSHAIDGYVYGVYSRDCSSVFMTGGTVSATNTSTSTATSKGARGITAVGTNISISGGSVSVTGYSAYGIEPYGADGNINISGTAEITATSNDASGYVRALDIGEDNTTYVNINVNISGGRIVANGVNTGSITSIYNLKNNTGAITIIGGEIIGAGRGINMTTSLGKLVIGDKEAALNKTNPLIKGGAYGIIAADTFEFYNGVIKGSNTVPYTGTPITQGEYYKVITEGPDSDAIYSSYIDFTPRYKIKESELYYDTLDEAIVAALDGNTIIVIGDCIDASNAIVNKNLTLDMNGYTISKEAYSITIDNGYTFNIIGNGIITTDDTINLITNNGNLNISEATLSNTNWSYRVICNQAAGVLTINSGNITAKYWTIDSYGITIVNGGTISASTIATNGNVRAIYDREGAKTIINAGTIIAENNTTETYGARGLYGVGEKVIKGGTITATGYSAIAVETYSTEEGISSSINISGSPTLTATGTTSGGYARCVSVGTSATTINVSIIISGGTFTTTAPTPDNSRGVASSKNEGTTMITGGEIDSNGYGIHVVSGAGKLTFGNPLVSVSQKVPVVIGGDYGIFAAEGFNFYNGVIKGSKSVPYNGEATPRELHSIKIDSADGGMYSAYLSQNKSLYEADAYLEETIFRYDGTAKEPIAVVTLNGNQLTQGTDYDVTYKNNINVGIGTVVITGINDYAGIMSLNFIISNTEVNNDQIILDLEAPEINEISVDVTSTKITVKSAIDDPSFADNIPGSGVNNTATRYLIKTDATRPEENDSGWVESNEFVNDSSYGSVFVWVKAVDNVGNYRIKELETTISNITNATYSLSPTSYEYDGTSKTPTVTVKLGETKLTQGTHYEVEYFNNIEVGVATAFVKGINDFGGSKELFFTIVDTTKPQAPTINARLSTYSGATYTSGTLTNKNVFIELTSIDAGQIEAYEWSTNSSSGFTSENIFMVNGKGRMRFDTEMNQTIFFRSKDKAGNYSNVSNIIIRIDKTAPTGSIDVQENYLKNSDKYVNNNTVTINVLASDNVSTSSKIKVAFVNEYEFSLSNKNSDISWFNYETTKSWTSSPGDGYKTVYVIFKDEAGNQSVYLAE